MSTKITYNSKTTEVANGKIATLSCNGKKMKSDIGIEVTDSPLPTEVSTEAEMTALLTSGEVGGVYKYTGTTGTYENGALYVLETSGFNLTLSGGWGGSTSGGGNTYIKINSQPTSSSDYDYDAKSLSSSGSVTVQATSYWYWDTSFGKTYATATEVVLTEDESAMFSYYYQGGMND